MQIVTLTFQEINVDETSKQHKAVWDTKTVKTVVSSTKTFNSLVDDYDKQGKHPTQKTVKQFKMDKGGFKKVIADEVKRQMPNDADIHDALTERLLLALELACAFKTDSRNDS